MAQAEQTLEDKREKEKPEEASESFDLAVSQVMGSSVERLQQEAHRERHATDTGKPAAVQHEGGERYYAQSGRNIPDLSRFKNGEPILRTSTDRNGNQMIEIYSDKNAALAGAALIRQTFSYRLDGDKIIESRRISARGESSKIFESTFDKQTLELSFSVQSQDLKQKITLDFDARATRFEIQNADKTLLYRFKDGKPIDVSIRQGDEVQLVPEADQKAFLEAAHLTLKNLRQANGIPEPLEANDNEVQPNKLTNNDQTNAARSLNQPESNSNKSDLTLITALRTNDLQPIAWDDFWTREFNNRAPIHHDPKSDSYTHHERFESIQHGFLHGTEPNGLNQLRELTYRMMGGAEDVEGSVQDYFAKLQYINSVGRFETAGKRGDVASRHEALVDLVALDKSSACTREVHEKIEQYLNGKNAPSRLELIVASQQVQQQLDMAQTAASANFVKILSNDVTVNELRSSFSNFESSARAANISPKVIEWARKYAIARELKETVATLESQSISSADQHAAPDIELQSQDPQELKHEQTQNTMDSSAGLKDVQELLSSLQSGDKNEHFKTIEAMHNAMSTEAVVEILEEGAILAQSAVTPRDILRLDIMNNPEALKLLQQIHNNKNDESLKLLEAHPEVFGALNASDEDTGAADQRERQLDNEFKAKNAFSAILADSTSDHETGLHALEHAKEFSEASSTSGNPEISAAKSWTNLFSSIKLLDIGSKSGDEKTRIEQSHQALSNLLEQSTDPLAKATVEAFGGQEKLAALINQLNSRDKDKALATIDQTLSKTALQQFFADLKSFRDLGSDMAINSDLFVRPESLQGFRTWSAADGLYSPLSKLEASEEGHFYQGEAAPADLVSASKAIDLLLAQSDNAAGRAMIESCGGRERLQRLSNALEKGDAKNKNVQEDLRAILSSVNSEATDHLKDRLYKIVKDLRYHPRSLYEVKPSALDIANAVEGAQIRAAAVNSQYDSLERQFLSRKPTARSIEQHAAQRERSLHELESFSLKQFAVGGDDERMLRVPEYTAMHQLIKLDESRDAGSAASALKELQLLNVAGNTFAQQYLNKLVTSDINKLIRNLESSDAIAAKNALETLKATFNSRELLDDYRTRAITHDVMVSGKPSAKQLDAVRADLRAELKAGNLSAEDSLEWANANYELARLNTNEGGAQSPEERRQAFDRLVALAESNNPHARQALFAVLEANIKGASSLGENGMRPVKVELGHLTAAEHQSLTMKALSAIDQSLSNGALLNSAEVRALAVQYGKVSADSSQNDIELSNRAAAILDKAWTKQTNHKGDEIMEGLTESMKTPELAGVRKIADKFLQHASHATYPEHLKDITRRAFQGDKTAMYVLAGSVGSKLIDAKQTEYTARAIRDLARDQQAAPEIVQAMIDRHQVAGDQSALLATLGNIVAQDSQLSNEIAANALNEIRRGVDGCMDSTGHVDSLTRTTYQSAIHGLMSMAHKWNEDDVVRLCRNVTPEVSQGLASAQIPNDIGKVLSKGMIDRLSSADESQRFHALKSIANTAKFLSKEQVESLAAANTNDEVGKQSQRVQAALGQALVKVIANGDTADIKETAVKHFLKSGWTSELRRELGEDAAFELAAYAQGKDVRPELRGMISEIGYGLAIAPPIPHLLRQMGMPADTLNDKQLELVIKNAGGEEQFRNLLGRIVAYESLPISLQHAVRTGETDLSSMAGSAESPAQPGSTAAGERVDLLSLLRDLENGKSFEASSQTSNFDFLKGPLFDARMKQLDSSSLSGLAALLGAHEKDVRYQLEQVRLQALTGRPIKVEDLEVKALKVNRSAQMKDLVENTTKGHGTPLWHVALLGAGYFFERDSNVRSFEAKQARQISDLKANVKQIEAAQERTQNLRAVVDAIDLAQRSQEIFHIGSSGDRKTADSLLMKLSNEHGIAALTMFAPQSLRTLNGSGVDSWERGAWGRAEQNGYTNLADLPEYHHGNPTVVSQALATLARTDLIAARKMNGDNSDEIYRMRTKDLIVHEALRALDSHPALIETSSATAALGKNWGELNTLVQAGVNGQRGPALVAHVREMVNGKEGLEKTLSRIQTQLPHIKQMSAELKLAYEKNPRGELFERIQMLERMVKDFDPNSPQMKQMTNMCRLVNSGSYDESTLWRSMRDSMVPIAATIGLAVCFALYFTPASPIAIAGSALLISAGGLLIREGWAEVGFRANWRGDRGALLGDAYRKNNDASFMVYDAAAGSFNLPPTYSEALAKNGLSNRWQRLGESCGTPILAKTNTIKRNKRSDEHN